ncbi:MAG: ornithine carbamoyltransferase [Gammaproteobacteria bacterium]|nr:ornithine carbamoyltransferase [Gammaproteobacteria bacterium]
MPRHFLTLLDFSPDELHHLIERARFLKAHPNKTPSLNHKVLAMIFEKSSTRTRVSFETAMVQMGGHAIFLSPRDTQLGRGEPIRDTARVLSRMANGILVRAHLHQTLEEFAAYSKVPVINALTDTTHPCQLLADLLTFVERRHRIPIQVSWIGDGNNMCHTYIHAAHQFGFKLAIATPPGYSPCGNLLKQFANSVTLFEHPEEAVMGADWVATDVWTSMGQERDEAKRRNDFKGFEVTEAIMQRAKPDAVFMHCLPAHRGEEVSDAVIEGPQSVVWEEAENRLHTQKALLEFLLL